MLQSSRSILLQQCSQELISHLLVNSDISYKMQFLYRNIQCHGLPRWCQWLRTRLPVQRCGFDSWVGQIPWKRAWQPTPVFLPGESRGQRSLVGYSPWSHKELGTTEAAQHACIQNHVSILNSWEGFLVLQSKCIFKIFIKIKFAEPAQQRSLNSIGSSFYIFRPFHHPPFLFISQK